LTRALKAARSLPFRVIVTLGLLGVVASNINWSLVSTRLDHGHVLDFAAAVALVLCALVLGAWRWALLLRVAQVPLATRALARIYWVAVFTNTFLPSSVGGDVTRTLLVARRPPMLTRAALTVVADRLGGLVGLLGMAWLASAFRVSVVPARAIVFLAWVTAAVVLGAIFLLVAMFRGSSRARVLVPARFLSLARELRELVHGYARAPSTLLLVVGASLLFQALNSLQLVMLAKAIDVHLDFATAAVVLALVTVVTLIPVSIGGFGIREGSYVVLLGGASIGATDATLISLLTVAALFIASLPGAVMLAHSGLTPAVEGASP
jgi:uncharacterized protein (TIRG00374 family)